MLLAFVVLWNKISFFWVLFHLSAPFSEFTPLLDADVGDVEIEEAPGTAAEAAVHQPDLAEGGLRQGQEEHQPGHTGGLATWQDNLAEHDAVSRSNSTSAKPSSFHCSVFILPQCYLLFLLINLLFLLMNIIFLQWVSAAQSSSRSIVVGLSRGLWKSDYQMETKTFLPSNLCDRSDSNNSCD